MPGALKLLTFAVLTCGFAACPALAENFIGMWSTAPDKKGQIAHVQATTCGEAICGKIIQVFDRAGAPIAHPNVGKRLFWNMVSNGQGSYKGRVFVPSLGKEFDGVVTIAGDTLKVRGCAGPLCETTTWQRLK